MFIPQGLVDEQFTNFLSFQSFLLDNKCAPFVVFLIQMILMQDKNKVGLTHN
jgi:hypothetical protein